MSAIKKYKSKSKLRSIHIKPAKNGYTVSTDWDQAVGPHDTQDDLGKGASIYDGGSEETVHKSGHSVAMHVKQHLARHEANNGFEDGGNL